MHPVINKPLKVLHALLPRSPLYNRGFWLALIVFAILFGGFLSRVTALYQRTEFVPQWSQAHWIMPGADSAVAYYRRELSLDSLPTEAYLQVAAPDSFQLYINGQNIQNTERASTAVFNLIDARNYLQVGRNVIAIRVERKTIPGVASLLANLYWVEPTGGQRELADSGEWRVALHEQRQNDGTLAWFENNFDDIGWPQAMPLNEKDTLPIQPVHPWASPELITFFPRGAWISHGLTDTTGTRFIREFDLGEIGRRDITFAGLGVASTTPYTLTINGVRGPTMDATNQYMDTYNMGNFLSAGKNTLAIDTSNVNGSGRIAIAAMVKTTNELLDLSADGNWRVRSYGSDWQPVTIMGKLNAYPYTEETTQKILYTPIIRLTEIHLPGGLLISQLVSALPWMTSVLLITLGIVVFGFSRCRNLDFAVVNASMLPLILTNVLLGVAFLLPFDIRITEMQVFNLPLALALTLLTLFLFAFIMSEVERDRGHH